MKDLKVWQAVVVASQLGFVFAAAVAIGLFAGWYVDSRLNTSPAFTILGAMAGTAAGAFSCAQMVRYLTRDGRSR